MQPKEGVLEKQTRDGRKWQKRHCELERGQLHLHYAEGKGQKKKFADTIVVKDIPIEIDPNDPKVLVVKAESRVFKFRAESPENAASWFSALKSHSACHF